MRRVRCAVAAATAVSALLLVPTTGHAAGHFNTVNGTGSNAPTFDPTSACNTVNNDGTDDTTELGQFAACNTINNDASSFGEVTDIIASSFNRVNNSDVGGPLGSGLGGFDTTVIEGGSSFNTVSNTVLGGENSTSLTNRSSFNTVTQQGSFGNASFSQSSFNLVTLGSAGDPNVATLTNSDFNTVTVACDNVTDCKLQLVPPSSATLTNASFSTIQAYGAYNVATVNNGAHDAINIGTVGSPVENSDVTITGSLDTVNDPYSDTDVAVSGNGVTLDCTGTNGGAPVTDMTPGTTSEIC
jgi:hypothetical protein